MNKTRILYFMLDNPMNKNSGNKTWGLKILQYFKDRKFDIDFVSERGWGMWTETQIQEFKKSGLVSNLFVLDRKPSKKNLITYFLTHKISNFFIKKKAGFYKPPLTDHITIFFKRQFNKILKENRYDYIIVNYVTCATVIENNRYLGDATTIIDTHDFFTSQYQFKRHFKIGKAFEEEIRRLSLFDEVWCVSAEEYYLFSQFIKNRKRLVQTMLDRPGGLANVPVSKRRYDLIYVASDNRHNVKSAAWFFETVYPLLPDWINICVIGGINHHISNYPNVKKLPYVEVLDDYYTQAKVALCPMLSGTGIKVKTVEAFSYGLPVVCNPAGVDGLLNKVKNGCLISTDPLEFAENIMALLTNNSLYEEQSRLSAEMFDLFFDAAAAYKKLDKVFGRQPLIKAEKLSPALVVS